MGDVNQNIRVRIDAALNGLPVFQQFSAVLDKIKSASGQKIEVGDAAAISQTNQLANSIDQLGKKIDSLKPSKFQEISTLLQGLAAGSNVLNNLGGSFESVTKGISFLRQKSGELIGGVAARAGPIIESVTSKVSGLAAQLPLIGEGGAAAAIGLGAVAAGGAVALASIAALIAVVVAIGAAITAFHAAVLAFVPSLIALALRVAETDAATGKLQNRLKGGEIQAIIAEIKQRVSDLTDELARALVPTILQLMRVALDLVNQLQPVLRPFFDFVITQIGNIGRGLVRMTVVAISAGKAIAAAIAIGLATGSPIEAAKAAVETYNKTAEELLKTINTPAPLGSGASGGAERFNPEGGDGRQRPPRPEDTSQSQLELDKAIADARYAALRDSLDRANQLVTEKYNDRKVTIAEYYEEVLRIEDDKLAAEQTRLNEDLVANQKQLTDAIAKIRADRESGAIQTDEEAQAKVINETNRSKARQVALEQQLNQVELDRSRLPHDIERKQKADTDALNESLQRQIDAIDNLRGLGPLVEARHQIEEIDKLIEQFTDNEGMVKLLEEWREVVGAIGQAQAAVSRYQKAQEVTEEKIAQLQERGSRNMLAQFINAEKIRRLRQEELKQLQQVLKLQEAIAKTAGGDAAIKVQIEIEKTKTKIAQLEDETKSFKDTFKDTFIDSVSNAMENFFTSLGDVIAGTKKLSDAFREMALSIIKDLEQIIAKMLVMLILKKLLGAFAGGDDASGGFPDFNPADVEGSAAGDFLPARPGGRLVWAAEGGHDEVILTTDPKHRRRTQSLLATFLQRTKLFDGFDLGGWISSITHPQFEISAFDAGGFISSAPAYAGAGVIHQTIENHFNGVKDHASFKRNQAAIERDIARAARRGVDRFRKG